MPINVLVTGANSTVSQSIIKALRSSSLDIRLFGGDINPYSPGLYRVDKAFLLKPYQHAAYETEMLELLRHHRIDVLFPGVEGELQLLAERKEQWERTTKSRVIINPRRVLDITQDKYETARFLASAGCSAPRSSVDTSPQGLNDFIDEVGFPVVIKPRRGASSRHVYVVRSKAELLEKLPQIPNAVLQECLGSEDEEYTCGIFVDAAGSLRGVATMRRVLENGITGTAFVDHFPDVEQEVRRIVAALRPSASCNIQLRRNREGRPTTFEINARFSSSVAIRAHFGFNEAEAAIRSYFLGEQVSEMACRPGVAMRYVNEVYAEKEDVQALITAGHHALRGVVEGNF